MSNYDDIFAGQSTDQHSREFVSFDKATQKNRDAR